MLHVNHFFGLNPTSWIIILHRVAAVGIILNFAWFRRPRSVAKQQLYLKKDLPGSLFPWVWGFQILLASSDKKELGARWCKMFHINRPLSPNSRWKWRFFQNLQGEWKFRKGTCPLKSSWEQKTITFTQGHPCWNRRLGFPRFFSQIVVLPFFGTKLWFKGGSPFWDPEIGASYWNWSVLNGWVFLGKLGAVVDRKNCLHFIIVQNVPC